MFTPLCVALYALCLPISPNDFWYHARAGSITATTGHIPTTNLFSDGWWNGMSVPPDNLSQVSDQCTERIDNRVAGDLSALAIIFRNPSRR